jgi:hypothetical protein
MYIILRIGDKKLLHENRDFFSAINQKKKKWGGGTVVQLVHKSGQNHKFCC